MVLTLDIGFLIIVIIGSLVDLATSIFWLICVIKHKIKVWPFLAFFCHFLYVIFVYINCAFAPYGRILGLVLNTAAVGLASLPTGLSWDKFHNQKIKSNVQTLIEDGSAITSQSYEMNSNSHLNPN